MKFYASVCKDIENGEYGKTICVVFLQRPVTILQKQEKQTFLSKTDCILTKFLK